MDLEAYEEKMLSDLGITKGRTLRTWSPLVHDLSVHKLVSNPLQPKIKRGVVETSTTTVDNHLRHLWITSKFSDLRIRLRDGNMILVHKNVLSRCSFFRAVCESSFKEAVENCITFPEDDECAILGMLMHLYGFTEVDWARAVFTAKFMPPSATIELYKVALKYDLPLLATSTLRLFDALVEDYVTWAISGHESDLNALSMTAELLYHDEYPLMLDRYLANIIARWAHLLLKQRVSLAELFDKCPQLASDLLLHGGVQPRSAESEDGDDMTE